MRQTQSLHSQVGELQLLPIETLMINKDDVYFCTKLYGTEVSEGREHSGPEQLGRLSGGGQNETGIQGSVDVYIYLLFIPL